MVNRLVHNVSVDVREAVETVAQLRDALDLCAGECSDDLDKTYIVELLREEFSDGSIVHSISIRPAEAV